MVIPFLFRRSVDRPITSPVMALKISVDDFLINLVLTFALFSSLVSNYWEHEVANSSIIINPNFKVALVLIMSILLD